MLENCFCSLVTLFINLQCENHLSNFSSLFFLAWQKFSFGQLLYFPEKQQGVVFTSDVSSFSGNQPGLELLRFY